MKDLWLPKGYEFTDGKRCRKLVSSNSDWQIYLTDSESSVVLAQPNLADKWIDSGFLSKELLQPLVFGSAKFYCLYSKKGYNLFYLEEERGPETLADAMAFAVSLRETRKVEKTVSLHDAIYVEQFSRLLPTWSLSSEISDDVVLGKWLSGGVDISTNSFRRLSMLVGWMSPKQLADIVSAAGLPAPNNVSVNPLKTHPKTTAGNISSATGEAKPAPQQNPVHATKNAQNQFALPGRPNLENFFNEHVIDIIFNPERYKALGIEFPSAIVLYGPPGCGKTFAVEKLVEFIDWPSFYINSNSVGSPFIHDTSKKISDMFDKAIDSSPSVLVIDEMEAFLSERSTAGSNLHHVEEVAEFLRRIPEAIENNVLIIAMTNMINLIDPAILRKGRFDNILEVGMPSREEVESLLNSLLSKIPRDEGIDVSPLLDALAASPLSDATFAVREAARSAAKAGKSRLDQESILSALALLDKSKGATPKKPRIGFISD